MKNIAHLLFYLVNIDDKRFLGGKETIICGFSTVCVLWNMHKK